MLAILAAGAAFVHIWAASGPVAQMPVEGNAAAGQAGVDPAPALAPAQITLSDAIATAYKENPTLGADREGLKILDEDVSTARAARRPSLVGEGSIVRSEFDVVGTGSIGGVRLTQPLIRGGRLRANIDAAEQNVLAGRETLRASEIETTLGVIRAYANVLRDREASAFAEASVRALSTIATAEGRKLELREGRITDEALAKARLGMSAVTLNETRQRLAESNAAFMQVVGVPPPDIMAPLPSLPSLPYSREAAIDLAVTGSPETRSARYAEKVAQAQERAARANLLPTIDGSASVQQRNEIIQILGRRVRQTLGTFLVTLTIPIFQNGSEYAAIRRAKHVAGVRREEIEEAERKAELDVSVAWSRLMTARDTETKSLGVVDEYARSLAGVTREASLNARTLLDVLDSERDLLWARITYANNRFGSYVAAAQLLAATGALTPEEFGARIDRYRPDDHYEAVRNKWIGTGP